MGEKSFSDLKKELELEHAVVNQFEIGGFKFLFRPLTIRELSLPVDKKISSVDLEDFYLTSATLHPAQFNWDKMKAGHVSDYIDRILEVSGFNDLGAVNAMLIRHRAAAESNIITSVKSYIITAMPAYKESDLLDISMDELIKLAVLSEGIITLQQQIGGMETTGFKLIISPVDEYEEEYVEEQAPAVPKKQKAAPRVKAKPEPTMSAEEQEEMKKAYIRRIRSNNQNIRDTTSSLQDFDTSWLEDLDEDALRTISGVTKSNDPIADKLNRRY